MNEPQPQTFTAFLELLLHIDLLGCDLPLGQNTVPGFFKVLDQVGFFDGLEQVIPDPQFHGLMGVFELLVAADQNEVDIQSGFPDLMDQFQAVKTGHPDV